MEESEEERGKKTKTKRFVSRLWTIASRRLGWSRVTWCIEAPEGIPKGWIDYIHLHIHRNYEKR